MASVSAVAALPIIDTRTVSPGVVRSDPQVTLQPGRTTATNGAQDSLHYRLESITPAISARDEPQTKDYGCLPATSHHRA